jgi:glycosyltransferase involved in cell wall biosynthesis
MAKLSILVIVDYYPPQRAGGLGVGASRLREIWTREGHSVTVLTTGSRTSESVHGVIRTSPFPILGIILNHLRVLKLIRSQKFDAVYLRQSSTTLFLPFLRKVRNPPVSVYGFHVSCREEIASSKPYRAFAQWFPEDKREVLQRQLFLPVRSVLDGVGYKFATHLTAITPAVANEITEIYGAMEPRNITVIPNGVAAKQPQVSERVQQMLSELEGRPFFVYCGIIRNRKRLGLLLAAMKILRQRQSLPHLLITAPDSSIIAPIRSVLTQHQIEKQVHFLLGLNSGEAMALMAEARALVLPSVYEGMPLVCLEAASVGTLSIVPDLPWADSLEKETILRFAPESADALANAMASVIPAKTRIPPIRVAGWENTAAAYIELFQQLSAQRTGR